MLDKAFMALLCCEMKHLTGRICRPPGQSSALQGYDGFVDCLKKTMRGTVAVQQWALVRALNLQRLLTTYTLTYSARQSGSTMRREYSKVWARTTSKTRSSLVQSYDTDVWQSREIFRLIGSLSTNEGFRRSYVSSDIQQYDGFPEDRWRCRGPFRTVQVFLHRKLIRDDVTSDRLLWPCSQMQGAKIKPDEITYTG